MKKLFLLSVVICAFLTLKLFSSQAYSDSSCDLSNLDCVNQQIDKLSQELADSQKATAPLQSQVQSLTAQLTGIENQVAAVEADIAQKKQYIDTGYKDLAKQQDIFNAAVRSYYIQSSYFSPLLVLFSSKDASYVTQIIAYQQHQTNVDKSIITDTALKITDLEDRKAKLETEQAGLAAAKAKLAVQKDSMQKIIDGALAYQTNLSSQIAQLSARQQQLIAAKQASLGLPTSAYTTSGGCSSDLTNGKDPGFSPRFGFFTFGVPHRVGLSQYGAWGRAKAGQDSDAILHAYFNFDGYQTFGNDITIRVNDSNGYDQGNIIWSGSLEDYVKRVYEVPDSWTDNNSAALKAQAIAARSYVLATTNNGASSICANQNCQVFKTDPKGGNWDSAVNATAGQAMIQGGKPIKAWFSSTAGGYFHSSSDVGWNATSWTKTGVDASGSVGSFSDLLSHAYDKDSPWFYCDWGARSQYSGTAWLTPAEVADIANVVKLAQITNQDQNVTKHLLQLDKSNSDGNWDEGQVRQELKNRGATALSSVSSVSVSADFGSGKATTITINGDAGSESFPADFFKAYFNLRAPANIQIVGPLYNVEQK